MLRKGNELRIIVLKLLLLILTPIVLAQFHFEWRSVICWRKLDPSMYMIFKEFHFAW